MFFRTFPLFTILGFRVRLDVSWLLLALLVVTSTAEGFRAPPHEVGAPAAVALGLFFAFGLLMSIVLHELSHSLVARRHGMEIRGITLFILGGVAEMEDEPEEPWAEFLMAIAGPISSVLIGAACGLVAWGAQAAGAPAAIVDVVRNLALMNVVLAVFNMIPAFPLDGGRVLRSILWGAKRDVLWATRIASFLGQAFGVLLVGAGIVMAIVAWSPEYLMWILIGYFVLRSAPMPYRLLQARHRLATATVARFVDEHPVVVSRQAPVSELLGRLGGPTAPAIDDMLPVVDGQRVVGFVSPRMLQAVPQADRASTPVGEIAARMPGDAVVHAATAADEALRRMQRLNLPTLLVVDATRLVGIVRWQDLRAFAESR